MLPRLAAVAASVAIAGCGGGGTPTPAQTIPPDTKASSAPAPLTFALTFTPVGSTAPASQAAFGSLGLTLVSHDGVAASSSSTQIIAGAPGCTLPDLTTGSETCTVTVPSVVGIDQYAVSGFASSSPTGVPARTGALDIAETGSVQQIGVVFSALSASSQTLYVTPPSIVRGTPQKWSLVANEFDAAGSAIIGTYPVPLVVSAPSGVSALTLTGYGLTHVPGLIVASSTPIEVDYDGGALPDTSVFTSVPAAESGLSTVTATVTATGTAGPGQPAPPSTTADIVATPTVVAFNGPQQSATVTVSQPGYSGGFLATTNAPQTANASVLGSTVTITTPPGNSVQAGTATISIVGGGGKTATVTALVTLGRIIIK